MKNAFVFTKKITLNIEYKLIKNTKNKNTIKNTLFCPVQNALKCPC